MEVTSFNRLKTFFSKKFSIIIMSRSLRPIYPVRPHYLRCLQLSQLPATPPSKAPVPQPFPSVRYLRMCLGKETAGNGSARHCRHCRKPGVRVTQGSAWSKRRTSANATARLRFHACARNHTALSLKKAGTGSEQLRWVVSTSSSRALL